jgi:hypothetical protein
MFGPEHPRRSGAGSLQPGEDGIDPDMPGFGASGTAGCHFFDANFHVYRRIAALARVRQGSPTLRYGRQYVREIRNFGQPFAGSTAGELITWSRILYEEEVLCIINGHGLEGRGADIVVDNDLNAAEGCFFEVIASTAQTAAGAGYGGPHPVGQRLPVRREGQTAYVEVRGVPASEVLVLRNGR